MWVDSTPQGFGPPPMNGQSMQNLDSYPGFPNPLAGGGSVRNGGQGMVKNDKNDEIIKTAIVIKNIPFALKKEILQTIMTEMGLPLPYAFNYHFEGDAFRGLAFANFLN